MENLVNSLFQKRGKIMSQVVYRKKTSTTYSPEGGISESRSREFDGVNGTDTVGLRRNMGDRHLEVLKTRNLRDPGAPIATTVTGHNVSREDEDSFDAQWTQEAQRRMPEYCQRSSGSSQIEWDVQRPMVTTQSQQRSMQRNGSHTAGQIGWR